MSRTHECRIPGCDTSIRVRFLLCHLHWQGLPRSLQDRVNDEYRTWMEVGQEHPTVGYVMAAEAAIKHVTEKEARGPATYTPSASSPPSSPQSP